MIFCDSLQDFITTGKQEEMYKIILQAIFKFLFNYADSGNVASTAEIFFKLHLNNDLANIFEIFRKDKCSNSAIFPQNQTLLKLTASDSSQLKTSIKCILF